MVYSGRPSTGCALCRARRKKCNETRPECQNCIRAGQACAGYRDKIDTMFKDETASIVFKARRPTRTALKGNVAKVPSTRVDDRSTRMEYDIVCPSQRVSASLGGSFELLMGGPSNGKDGRGLSDATIENPQQIPAVTLTNKIEHGVVLGTRSMPIVLQRQLASSAAISGDGGRESETAHIDRSCCEVKPDRVTSGCQ